MNWWTGSLTGRLVIHWSACFKHQRMDTSKYIVEQWERWRRVCFDATISHYFFPFSLFPSPSLRTLFHKCEHEEPLVLIVKTLKGSVSDMSLNTSFVSFLRFLVPS